MMHGARLITLVLILVVTARVSAQDLTGRLERSVAVPTDDVLDAATELLRQLQLPSVVAVGLHASGMASEPGPAVDPRWHRDEAWSGLPVVEGRVWRDVPLETVLDEFCALAPDCRWEFRDGTLWILIGEQDVINAVLGHPLPVVDAALDWPWSTVQSELDRVLAEHLPGYATAVILVQPELDPMRLPDLLLPRQPLPTVVPLAGDRIGDAVSASVRLAEQPLLLTVDLQLQPNDAGADIVTWTATWTTFAPEVLPTEELFGLLLRPEPRAGWWSAAVVADEAWRELVRRATLDPEPVLAAFAAEHPLDLLPALEPGSLVERGDAYARLLDLRLSPIAVAVAAALLEDALDLDDSAAINDLVVGLPVVGEWGYDAVLMPTYRELIERYDGWYVRRLVGDSLP